MEKAREYSDQIYQENLMLKKILNITIIPPNQDKLFKMYSGQAVYDESINALLAKQQKTLMENRSVFDTLLSNMLGSNDCIGLQALLNALSSIAEEKDKSINQNEQMQKFLTFF